MSGEKAIVAGVRPVMQGLVALEKRVEQMQLVPGPAGAPGKDPDPAAVAQILAADSGFTEQIKGAPGVPGKDGKDGSDGAGMDAPQWKAGAVYREGTVVVANIGQYFRALKDTASSPDEPDHWQRVGAGGLRYRGAFKADAVYVDGDLFVKDFGTFCVIGGTPVLLAGRGSVGKTGEPGARGAPRSDGSAFTFDVDMRFLKGRYVDVDGRLRDAAFAFV
jgi:hypothetical protein